MIISKTNSYNIYPTSQNIRVSNPKTANFCGFRNVDSIEPFYTTILSKFKDFSIAEYKTLTEQEKNRLREEYSKLSDCICLSESRNTPNTTVLIKNNDAEKFHDVLAERLKQKFDKKYGKGNYTVICIGRSVSSVGKVLGYKIGEDNVKNIPMSGASRYFTDLKYVNSLEKNGSIDNFRKYLNSIGLKKEDIENSDRKYIILDYRVTGKSLLGASKLMRRDDVLGDKNIITKDVMDCITNKDLKEKADGYFFTCTFKNLSFVEQAKFLGDMTKFMVDTTKEKDSIRLMRFKLLDNEMLKQEKNQNPLIRWLNKLW